jgi:hypothetical protein
MFASDEEKDAKKQPPAAAAAPKAQQDGQQQQAAAANEAASAEAPDGSAAAVPAAVPAAAAAVDYSSWPVKELRRFLTERGVDSSSIVEKQELVDMVSRGAAAQLSDAGPRFTMRSCAHVCCTVGAVAAATLAGAHSLTIGALKGNLRFCEVGHMSTLDQNVQFSCLLACNQASALTSVSSLSRG